MATAATDTKPRTRAKKATATSATGSGPSNAAESAWAISPIVCGSPEATLYGRSPGLRPSKEESAATLARATSLTWTKSRRCAPSSKTRTASPRSSAERKMAATPAYGVSRGIAGPYTLW